MSVRAKFYVTEVTRRAYPGVEVKMSAVCRGEDNKKWSAATPAANLSMSVLNELAADQFEPGQEFYIDFTPAPKGEPGMGE